MDPDDFPTLDPELADFLRSLPEPVDAFDDIKGAREQMKLHFPADQTHPGLDGLEITDEVVPGSPDVTVRVYRPINRRREDAGRLPGLLNLHGGGFCVGSVQLEHGSAVSLAHQLGVVVVSVEYRLAPEDPYPAALEDCYLALRYLANRDDVDPERVAVHGQSAGGGLAAALCLLARDRGGPAICFQALGIPELDDRLSTPSMRAHTNTPMWSRPQAETSWRLYLGGTDADQYAAPARAGDLTGLPPAYVATAELDPLRDEGLLYAMRLMADGVSVEVHSYPGTFHGAAIVRTADVVKRMNAELVGVLGRALA